MDSVRHNPTPALALLIAVLALPGAAAAAESLDSLQKTVADLARVRAEISRIESEWRWQKQSLTGTVEALRLRHEALTRQQDELGAQSALQDQQAETLARTAAEARAQLDAFDQHLRAIAAELVELRRFLPPRLSLALELPYRSLADDTIPVAERMQYVSTIWSRCAQFNRAIVCEEEALALEPDRAARVFDVIYWGLSHGYALDRAAGVAYVGGPTATGWTWRADAALAPRVARLIAIYRDQADPESVTLPFRVWELPEPASPAEGRP